MRTPNADALFANDNNVLAPRDVTMLQATFAQRAGATYAEQVLALTRGAGRTSARPIRADSCATRIPSPLTRPRARA